MFFRCLLIAGTFTSKSSAIAFCVSQIVSSLITAFTDTSSSAERYIKTMMTKHWSATGGSGSGFDCVFMLTKGNYSVNVGNGGSGNLSTRVPGKVSDGGNSRFGDSYAYGGGGGNCSAGPALTPGAAGSAPTLAYTVISSALNRAGNSGQTGTEGNFSGGASIYGSYGKGGDCLNNASVVNGTAGYVKVVFLGR